MECLKQKKESFIIEKYVNNIKEERKVEEEILTLEEQKQILIDAYINLMRIKKVQKEVNEELEYQIKTTRVKLSTFGIDISELEF